MLKAKFIGKYMRLAKQVGEDKNPCYSRQIGTVLVDPVRNKVLGTGYNGPPRDVPHCDAEEYLRDIVWPQLSREDRRVALESTFGERTQNPLTGEDIMDEEEQQRLFLAKASGCGKCPRKLICAPSGERLELCSCEHSERNAIFNASCDLHGAWAFCWCGVACWDCAKALIQNGVNRCFFIDDGSYARNGGADYSFGSRWLFKKAGVSVMVEKPEFYLEG